MINTIYALVGVLFIAVFLRLLFVAKHYISAKSLIDAINIPFVILNCKKAYCNQAAASLLDIDTGGINIESVSNRIGNKTIKTALLSGREFEDEVFFVGGRKITASLFPIFRLCKCLGNVVLFNEVTELAETQKKLRDSLELIESLRFVNHDFMNRMHVLMVYLETEQWENAKDYIGSLQKLSVAEISSVVKMIQNPAIASLVLSKIKKAGDFGISLNIIPDTGLKELTKGIEESEYITIVGNLLENAIDELRETSEKPKNIDLFIKVNSEWSLISVTDNGRGLNNEKLERIFDTGYSTKEGNERGIGLCAVKSIAEKHRGTVEVETEPGEGFFINVVMGCAETCGED